MFDGSPIRPPAVYRGPGILTQVASEPWQLQSYHRLRQAVFVEEQGLFIDTDEDELDGQAFAIVAMTVSHGMPDEVVGTVRIFRKPSGAPHVWYGGRLAVEPAYRRQGSIGDGLIRAAVCSAHAMGCGQFLATVQLPVVRYFERHHFSIRGNLDVCGVSHALMEADLSFYPARYFGTPGACAAASARSGAPGWPCNEEAA
jgi:putative N-acetyltransferase (TIGR04045 family)